MENNFENKARFFAQYYGQNVKRSFLPEQTSLQVIDRNVFWIGHLIINGYLELKSIEDITDEDAICVAKIVSPMLFDGDGNNDGHIIDKSEIKSGWISVKHKRKITMVDIDLDGFVFEYHEDEGYTRPSLVNAGADYLRSQGYALPWMGLSIDDLIKYGWVKLKKVDNETVV